ILKKHKDLVFFLKKQQLLKLILNNNINEAIIYSQQELASYVKEKPSLINEIDDVMMLMAYQDFNNEEAKNLIQKIEKKKNTLKRIDDIILNYYNVDSGMSIQKDITLLLYILTEKVPKIKNLKSGYIEYYEKYKKKKRKSSSKKYRSKDKDKVDKHDKKNVDNIVKDFDVTNDEEYRSV
ncbi:hypothetical protein PFHG_04699, partial [Plasmodium falciparum HB3]